MLDPVLNFSKATLTAGIASGVTTLVVSSGEGAEFPLPSTDGAFNLVLWNSTDYGDPADDPDVEIVRCTTRVTDTFTIVRAQEGTSDVNHNTVDKVYKIALPFTAKEHDEIAIQYATETVNSNHTAGSYGNILCDASGGSFSVYLPAAAGVEGRIYTIKKIAGTGAQTVTIDPNGTETIDGSTTLVIVINYTAIKIVSSGSAWFII